MCDKTLRTMEIRIKKGHKLYPYFDDMCFKSKNLYNITNFYVRQVFSGIKKDPVLRQINEQEVINNINKYIPLINEIKINTAAKKNTTPKTYPLLSEVNPYVNYDLINGVLKTMNQIDYISLPAHTNQHIIKKVFADWKSFFESIKDYKINPSKYKGCPRPPKYAKKNGRKTCIFSNQVCVIKDNKYLKFPKIKTHLNIGKIGNLDGILKEVRVTPNHNYFTVQVVVEIKGNKPLNEEPKNIIGIDLGVNNFATITNNIDIKPIIINGRGLKSINQFYNKKRAKYFGILRHGHNQKEGLFHSQKLNSLDTKRNDKIKDFMHKASHFVVNYCTQNNIDTIVIGLNDGFKDDIKLRKVTKQTFTNIPFTQFVEYVKYKAAHKGVRVIITEESYTSKASFIDNDKIPVYEKGNNTKYSFSGKRIKRGLYISNNGTIINADSNGSGNIIRKVVPNAFNGRGNRGVVDIPQVLSIA